MRTALKKFAVTHELLLSRVNGADSRQVTLAPWREQTSNADQLLARWLKGMKIPFGTAMALSGVGDGSHIQALLNKLPKSGLIFCAEPDVVRFKAFLATPLASSLLDDGRVAFGVGAIDDLFFNALASPEIMEFENVEPLIFAPLFDEAEDYYLKFFADFAQQVELWRKLYGTQLTKSGLWQDNSFRNFNTLIRTPDPIEFYGAFKGLPMVMAGAGPSLDESLDFLRWAQDRSVIVAGNSSIRALVNGGVRPHFVLAADPNPSTDSGFVGVDLGETILFCPFMVYPKVVERFDGRISAWSHSNALATYFRKIAGKELVAHVTEQGTISACAFDFAITLGCSSLFFVGQDLAARVDGGMHAKDSFYTDEGQSDRANLEKCRWLPGNTIEKVPVEEKLFVYLKTFEQLANIFANELQFKDRDPLKIFNLSRLGAKIKNMPYLDFEEAKSLFDASAGKDSSKGWALVCSVLKSHSVGWGRVGKAMHEFRTYIEDICSFALKHALAVEQEQLELAEAQNRKSELEAKIEAHSDFAVILNDGQMRLELFAYRKVLSRRSGQGGESSGAAQLEESGEYFWAVAEGSYRVLASMDAAREASKA